MFNSLSLNEREEIEVEIGTHKTRSKYVSDQSFICEKRKDSKICSKRNDCSAGKGVRGLGGGSDGEGGLKRFSRGVIGDNDRVISNKEAIEVEERLVHLRMEVKFEVLIEKKKIELSLVEEILVEEDEDDRNKRSS
ncbi:hypothetical protein Tco_0742430 [Tanacetum coccineum]